MQDRSQIYSEEEYRYELENRMKNLLWTVSGDYDLDVNLDLDSFRESQYIPSMMRSNKGHLRVIFPRTSLACIW